MDTDHRTDSSAPAAGRRWALGAGGRSRAGKRLAVQLPTWGLLVALSLAPLLACAQEPGEPGSSAQDSTAPTIVPAGRLRPFSVTAYCTGKVTQSGARVKAGMAAADPRVLPVGSTLRVDGQGKAYDGIYTVTDTGREIKGRELDLYLDDCAEATEFGRRTMRVAVIRFGWDPTATPGGPAAR
jgi:3D (Asp-Asp-Asp) domain-containing protein